MAVFRVKVEVVLDLEKVCCQRSIRKVKPRFTEENECGIF